MSESHAAGHIPYHVFLLVVRILPLESVCASHSSNDKTKMRAAVDSIDLAISRRRMMIPSGSDIGPEVLEFS